MSSARYTVIDVFRGLGCMAIVFHHLAFYGPMSDVVGQTLPGLMDGLVRYGRQAVQMFFVFSGFFAAAHLACHGSPAVFSWPVQVARRYRRLIVPYLFAVAFAMLVTALVRPWFVHESLSDAPGFVQVLAHVLLLHDILGFQALSAGVWYVAIDFQLFVFAALLCRATRTVPWGGTLLFPAMILLLTAVSLFAVNIHAQYDSLFFYFMGAYGLGMLAWWAIQPGFARGLPPLIVVLGVLALLQQFRIPVLAALVTAVVLVGAGRLQKLGAWPDHGVLVWLGHRSYSIFLVHFGVCVVFNALWSRWFPDGFWVNAAGMLFAAGASVAAGAVLYRQVEVRPDLPGFNLRTGVLVLLVLATFMIERSIR